MKRFFKAVFCVLTICAMISFIGCGGDEKKDADKSDKGSATSAETNGDKDGSDNK